MIIEKDAVNQLMLVRYLHFRSYEPTTEAIVTIENNSPTTVKTKAVKRRMSPAIIYGYEVSISHGIYV